MSSHQTEQSRASCEIPSAAFVTDDVRRAREFYRYLQPDNLVESQSPQRGSGTRISDDHTPSLSRVLAPFCQLTAMRCNASKAMLNVMDRDVMYFLSEASRTAQNDGGDLLHNFVEDPILMSCSSVPLKGRICELTIRLEHSDDNSRYPMFVIPDLSKSHFAKMAIIEGPPYYRFYAGTPITTRDGVNIGSLAIMDPAPRSGLSVAEEAFLGSTAQQIMTYLETNRQAIEGRRLRRMAKGLDEFIAGKSSTEIPEASHTRKGPLKRTSTAAYGLPVPTNVESDVPAELPEPVTVYPQAKNIRMGSLESLNSVSSASETTETEDQRDVVDYETDSRSHSKTFARAANLIRECWGDLGEDGSVSFLSLTSRLESRVRQSKPSPDRSAPTDTGRQKSTSKANSASGSRSSSQSATVIALSMDEKPFAEGPRIANAVTIDDDVLRGLMKRYPSGRLWNLEDLPGSSSEDDDRDDFAPQERVKRRSRRRSIELKILKAAFPKARQLLFAPLWDATIGSFAHGVFLASTLEARSFNTTSELSFLNSFCSTIMAECSRLDTMRADKQKSDFVGTISHEMRSPLHGVLASVEFMAETEMDGFQQSLIDTIDSCGRTLLDTINHVLDFSKVNSFQKHWQASNKKSHNRRDHYLGPDSSTKAFSQGAPPLLQLFGMTDISAVLEEVVDGLVLGQSYSGGIDITDISREARGRTTVERKKSLTRELQKPLVNIIMDVQQADWTFMTQPGAVRRIIMNITGNAMKYTSEGSIMIKLELKEAASDRDDNGLMVFTVTDTGRGISSQFLSSKLFVPFAQENSLAPGTGLGLSIVHSIVTMLGGTIDVQSKIGHGTTVQVSLPMKRPIPGQQSAQHTPLSAGTGASSGSSTDDSITLLKNQAASTQVVMYRTSNLSTDDLQRIVAYYVQNWYHLTFIDQVMVESASVVIVEEDDLEALVSKFAGTPGGRPAVVVLCSIASRHSANLVRTLEQRMGSAVEFLAKPCGPYKLARSIRLALEKKKAIRPNFSQVKILGGIAEIPTPDTSITPYSAVDDVSAGLHDLDLSPPGESDLNQLVHASERFAASQSSQHAQMALHHPNPELALRSPGASTSEGGAFPFPTQEDLGSKMRREINRDLMKTANSTTVTQGPKSSLKRLPDSVRSQSEVAAVKKINPQVLLVDDNKINLKLLETFLMKKRNYSNIAIAENGKQALDAVIGAEEHFDMIFMDISMPVMNGFEATRAIRDHEEANAVKPGAMVIALTGLANGRDQSEGFDSGCDIYMTKPVSFKEVGKLLDNWEAHQQLASVPAASEDENFATANSILEANGLQQISRNNFHPTEGVWASI